MDNNHGVQPLLDHLHERIEKGLTRARIPGELIYDKLVGQKDSNMISLPSVAAAVLAAAARAALPPLHRRGAWQLLGCASWRMYMSHAPARRSHARTTCLRILRRPSVACVVRL